MVTEKMMKQQRLNVLLARGDKNIKSGGVVRKLRRQIRNLDRAEKSN